MIVKCDNRNCFDKASRSTSQNGITMDKNSSIIPGGAQTFSKAPFQHVNGVTPKSLQRGQGAFVWDLDDNRYVDYMLGLGPVILGHCDADLNCANELDDGIAISLPHKLEAMLAEKLCELIPCAEMVRFGKTAPTQHLEQSGSTSYHKGQIIATCGYHGYADWFIGSTGRNAGVPSQVSDLTKNLNIMILTHWYLYSTSFPSKSLVWLWSR